MSKTKNYIEEEMCKGNDVLHQEYHESYYDHKYHTLKDSLCELEIKIKDIENRFNNLEIKIKY